MRAVSEVARQVEARLGTAHAEKMRMQAEVEVGACLAEVVTARLAIAETDEARRILTDDRVKMALGLSWDRVTLPLERRIAADEARKAVLLAEMAEAEAQRAREIAEAAAIQSFKAFVTESLALIVTDAEHATISYDRVASDMPVAAFKKSYPGAEKLPPADPVLEKYFPGRVSRLRPGATECAACARDSAVISYAELMGGRLSEALVERRGGKGPALGDLGPWHSAFREAVRAALSARFATVTEVGGSWSAMVAHLVKRTAKGDGPAVVVDWSNRQGAAVLSVRLWGNGRDAHEKLLASARASEERAQQVAERLENVKRCSHVKMGAKWYPPVADVFYGFEARVIAIHPAKGTVTVRRSYFRGFDEDHQLDCEYVPGPP